jgi:hypothetical protein
MLKRLYVAISTISYVKESLPFQEEKNPERERNTITSEEKLKLV